MLEYQSTYRGQDIYIDRARYDEGLHSVWTQLFDPKWYVTVAACKRAIDAYLDAPPPTPPPVYTCPICGAEFSTQALLDGHIALMHVGPPPPPPGDYLAEVYRDVEIWWITSISAYRAQVAVGYVAVGVTRTLVRAEIDRILGALYPPEDPETGLFAQVTAAVKAWVLENVPGWVLEWGTVVNNLITNVVENITNVYNDLSEYVTNVYNNVTEQITNVFNDTYNYVTNVIGVTQEILDRGLADNREWMTNFAKLMDPMGFLRDPLGYIKAAFAVQGEIANNLVVKSFWEGFEEGLAEEEA